MKRVLPFVLLLACSAPAFGQTVDSQGAKQLTDNLAHYFGKKPFDIGFVKVSVEGDAYKLAFDFKPLAEMLATQQAFKFELTPYAMLVKPREDARWDVSMEVSPKGSFDFVGPEGPQHVDVSISDHKFNGVYDPDLAAFASANVSIGGMTMAIRETKQQANVRIGSGTATLASTKSADGGIDFTASEKLTNFVETVKVNDPEKGLSLPLAVKAPELSVDATGKGLRTKALLDLFAFIAATDDEAKLKANEVEFKSLLTAALPLWERIDGTYGFKDFEVESPVGKFGAAQLSTAVGMDGIAKDGKINYAIKASSLTVPHQMLPVWSVALLPTNIDLNFGGANIDLDSMARKAIETLDFSKDPPLPADFGDEISADFLAKTPKFVLGHSTVRNDSIVIAMEGEMTFPGKKPDADVTIDVTGYDKIVASLQEAAKTDPQASQAFTGALAIKGFAKTLPDGRIEWVINARHDGSVTVNGAMLKGPDPVVEDDQDASPGEGNSGGAGAKLQP